MLITVECAKCKQPYDVDEKYLGRQVSCQSCKHTFVLAAAALPPPPLSSDPFENAAFETPKPAKPTGRPAKWQNPIETNALSAADDPRKNAPTALHLGQAPLVRVRHFWVDKSSLYILLLFIVATFVYAISLSVQIFQSANDSSARNNAIMQLWECTILADILFFVLIVPIVLLAMWATARIFGFKIGDIAYLRAGAVSALPFFIMSLAAGSSVPVWFLLALLVLPVTFFGLKKFFELNLTEWAVGSGLSAVGFIVGCLIVSFLGMIPSSGSKVDPARSSGFDLSAYARQFQTASDDKLTAHADNPSQPSQASRADRPQPAANDDDTLARFKDLVSLKTGVDLSQATVEERMADVNDLKRQLASLRPRYKDDPEWSNLTHAVEAFEQKVSALPSGKVDPTVMADPADAEDWTTGSLSRGKLGAEVSFKQFKFRPPLDMKMDLRSSEDAPSGLEWIASSNRTARLSIYTTPRKNAKQRRPVVSDQQNVLRVANDAGMFTINGANLTSRSGIISGMPFTRVAVNAEASGEHWVEFITPADDRWLIIHLVMPLNNAQLGKIMDASARTIRLTDAGEAKADPFAAKFIAPRLVDDYERAASLLHDQGPQAEDAVAALLKSPDHVTRQRALELLQDIATEKSLPALRKEALDPDVSNAALARIVLKRLGASTAP